MLLRKASIYSPTGGVYLYQGKSLQTESLLSFVKLTFKLLTCLILESCINDKFLTVHLSTAISYIFPCIFNLPAY